MRPAGGSARIEERRWGGGGGGATFREARKRVDAPEQSIGGDSPP
jgi:hypothetical protein